MKNIRLFLATYAVLLTGLAFGLPALASAADPSSASTNTAKSSVCQALNAGTDCSQTTQGTVSINSLISTIVNIFSFVIGVVAVIMIIVAGYRYVASGGDSSKIATAKSTITYALIGLVVAALAQGLVRFVLKSL